MFVLDCEGVSVYSLSGVVGAKPTQQVCQFGLFEPTF